MLGAAGSSSTIAQAGISIPQPSHRSRSTLLTMGPCPSVVGIMYPAAWSPKRDQRRQEPWFRFRAGLFGKLAQVNVVAGLALDRGGGYECRTDLASTSLLVPWFLVRRPFSALGALAVFRVKLLLLLGAALGSKRLVVNHSAQRAHLAQSSSDSCRWK